MKTLQKHHKANNKMYLHIRNIKIFPSNLDLDLPIYACLNQETFP